MKKLLLTLGLLWSAVASAQFVPGQLLTAAELNTQFALYSPLAGATFTGPVTIPTLTVTSSVTFPAGAISLSSLATQAANTVVANVTASSATPTAVALPSCSTSASALQYTTATGFACNTAVNAAQLGGATFASPGPIGSGTPSTGAFTTLSGTTVTAGAGGLGSSGGLNVSAGGATISGGTTVTSSFTATGLVTLGDLATQATNTILANATAGTASPTAIAIPSCSTTSSALNWTTSGGSGAITCNTAINASTLGGATFASPGAIGSTTASTGRFTTLTVTTGGANITGGVVVASGGESITGGLVMSTGTITPVTTSGIVGTTLADNAVAGSDGEFPTNSTSATSLTTGTPANCTSLSLTAGDWDVQGIVQFVPAGSTVPTQWLLGLATTSATFGAFQQNTVLQGTFNTGGATTLSTPVVRFNVSTTTTVFLVSQAAFTVSTMTCNGFIRARRVR